MFTVPGETPVTSPVELTVAIEVFEEAQGFVTAAVAEPVNWELLPTQVDKVPETVGIALTVKVAVI